MAIVVAVDREEAAVVLVMAAAHGSAVAAAAASGDYCAVPLLLNLGMPLARGPAAAAAARPRDALEGREEGVGEGGGSLPFLLGDGLGLLANPRLGGGCCCCCCWPEGLGPGLGLLRPLGVVGGPARVMVRPRSDGDDETMVQDAIEIPTTPAGRLLVATNYYCYCSWPCSP